MGYEYTTINGQRVEVNVAAAFQKMRAAFEKQFGLDLLVSSGTRTRAEQADLYRLYKAGKGNLAAAPGFSNHEEDGPRGPRALDLRDSGRDFGVTRIGTVRSNWLAKNAPAYGFTPAGHFFSQREAWHYEFTGKLAASAPAPAPAPSGLSKKGNPFGIPTAVGLQKIARLYGYRGKNDDIWGAGSGEGFAQFLRQNWGYKGNRVLGPVMWRAIARWLRARWGYKGNDVPGPVMRAALKRAEAANNRELR